MADGRKELGTQTYDQHLEELIEAGHISPETKRAALATGGTGFATSRRSRRAASS
jgi:Tfp pilus assembly ATPase PilU